MTKGACVSVEPAGSSADSAAHSLAHSELPALSVIVVVGPRRAHAERMLADLAAQQAREALEVVLVDTAVGAGPIAVPRGLRAKVVPHDDDGSYARSRVAGLAHCRAPVVAFIEDHCFPEPGWAGAVIEAHREPWAAVSYRIINANPEGYFGRAGMMADFGPWVAAEGRTESRYLASNNVSYKRAVLDAHARDLPVLFAPDQVFFEVLAREGHKLCFDGGAVAAHWNVDRPVEMARATIAFSRLYAANRARTLGWSRRQRLLYGLLVPFLSVPLRTRTLFEAVRRQPALAPDVLATLPFLMPSFIASGLGSSLGYLGGPGGAEGTVNHLELSTERGGA
jgi:hypothetical protein